MIKAITPCFKTLSGYKDEEEHSEVDNMALGGLRGASVHPEELRVEEDKCLKEEEAELKKEEDFDSPKKRRLNESTRKGVLN